MSDNLQASKLSAFDIFQSSYVRKHKQCIDSMGFQSHSKRCVYMLTEHVVDTYKNCHGDLKILDSRPQRILTNPSMKSKSNEYDNAEGNLIVKVNDQIFNADSESNSKGLYSVIDLLGVGTFGQVFRCYRESTREYVALKVIKSMPAYYNQGLIEVKILNLLNRKYDPNNQRHIVKLIESFEYKSHICLVFELLTSTLLDVLTQNQYRGLPLTIIQKVARQLLISLVTLQDANIIHCDLKPENILLVPKQESGNTTRSNSVDNSSSSPSSLTKLLNVSTFNAAHDQLNSQGINQQHNILSDIKLIDFGSACTEGQTMFSYIQSRFYRAPEVLIGIPYNGAIDMWSFACVCVELYLGLPLFPGVSQHNQLTRIIEMFGQPSDNFIAYGKNCNKYFYKISSKVETSNMPMSANYMINISSNNSSNYLSNLSSNYNATPSIYRLKTAEEYARDTNTEVPVLKRYLRYTKLEDVIMKCTLPSKAKPWTSEQKQEEFLRRQSFLDFLKGLFNLNQFERWTAKQAAGHPFITNVPWKDFLAINHSNSMHSSSINSLSINKNKNTIYQPAIDPRVNERKLAYLLQTQPELIASHQQHLNIHSSHSNQLINSMSSADGMYPSAKTVSSSYTPAGGLNQSGFVGVIGNRSSIGSIPRPIQSKQNYNVPYLSPLSPQVSSTVNNPHAGYNSGALLTSTQVSNMELPPSQFLPLYRRLSDPVGGANNYTGLQPSDDINAKSASEMLALPNSKSNVRKQYSDDQNDNQVSSDHQSIVNSQYGGKKDFELQQQWPMLKRGQPVLPMRQTDDKNSIRDGINNQQAQSLSLVQRHVPFNEINEYATLSNEISFGGDFSRHNNFSQMSTAPTQFGGELSYNVQSTNKSYNHSNDVYSSTYTSAQNNSLLNFSLYSSAMNSLNPVDPALSGLTSNNVNSGYHPNNQLLTANRADSLLYGTSMQDSKTGTFAPMTDFGQALLRPDLDERRRLQSIYGNFEPQTTNFGSLNDISSENHYKYSPMSMKNASIISGKVAPSKLVHQQVPDKRLSLQTHQSFQQSSTKNNKVHNNQLRRQTFTHPAVDSTPIQNSTVADSVEHQISQPEYNELDEVSKFNSHNHTASQLNGLFTSNSINHHAEPSRQAVSLHQISPYTTSSHSSSNLSSSLLKDQNVSLYSDSPEYCPQNIDIPSSSNPSSTSTSLSYSYKNISSSYLSHLSLSGKSITDSVADLNTIDINSNDQEYYSHPKISQGNSFLAQGNILSTANNNENVSLRDDIVELSEDDTAAEWDPFFTANLVNSIDNLDNNSGS